MTRHAQPRRWLCLPTLLFCASMALAPAGAMAQGLPDPLIRFGPVDLVEVGMAGKAGDTFERTAFRSVAAASSFGERAHLILQFDRVLSLEDRLALEDEGVELLEYVPGQAYLARFPVDLSLDRLAALGARRYMVPGPAHKMHPRVYEQLTGRPANQERVRISYAGPRRTATDPVDDASHRAVRLEVETIPGVRVLEESPRLRYLVVEAAGAALMSVAALPVVTSVTMASSPSDGVLPPDGLCCHPNNWQDGWQHRGAMHTTSSRANVLHSGGLGLPELDGTGVVVGVGDQTYLGNSHVDLRGRHTILRSGSGTVSFSGGEDHGVHTSGTVGGAGVRVPRYVGLAPGATVLTAQFENILTLGLEGPSPMVISSNSWNSSDPVYQGFWEGKGRYNSYSRAIDQLLHEEVQLLSLHSAGNSGGLPDGDLTGYPQNYVAINPSYGSAKNALVIGGNASFGPTRDGRTKPDMVAYNRVIATTIRDQYVERSGSSMATPSVAGIAALLHEQFRRQHGTAPDGGLLKAILMNSADDLDEQGPTFSIGYGMVNARSAARVISRADHEAGSVDHGSSAIIPLTVPAQIDGQAIARLKVMLYWNDPAGSAYADPALVNDLDLELRQGAAVYQPWVLDTTRTQVAAPATRGVDRLNNAEQVSIDTPAAGAYEIRVSGSTVPFGPQPFFVVFSYVLDEFQLTFPLGSERLFTDEVHQVFWDRAAVAATVQYSIEGGPWLPAVEGNGGALTGIGYSYHAFPWVLPEAELSRVQVRIQDGGGRTSTSGDVVVSPRISLSVSQLSAGGYSFSWNAVPGSDRYELLRWSGDRTWTVVASTDALSVDDDARSFSSLDDWYSVRAVSDAKGITSQRSDAVSGHVSNTAPVVVDDLLAARYRPGSPVNLDVLANDLDADGDELFLSAISPSPFTPNGALVHMSEDGSVRFDWQGNTHRTDTITYTISDGHGGTATGTLVVLAAPHAIDDAAEVDAGNSVTVDVVANDLADPNEPLSLTSIQVPPKHGMAVIDPDGRSITYSAHVGFGGLDSLRYVVRSTQGSDVNENNTAYGWLRLTVSYFNTSAPVAATDAYETQEDTPLTVDASGGLLSNDSDADSAVLQAILEQDVRHGSLALQSDGSFVYTPNRDFFGTDSLRYTASDGFLLSDPATVRIVVLPVNDPPSAADILAPTSGAIVTVAGDPGQPVVFEWNPSTDVDGDPVTYDWHVARSTSTSSPILSLSGLTEPAASPTVADLAAALTLAGAAAGASVRVVSWVESSDGTDRTVGPVTGLTLVRGSVTSADAAIELPDAVTLEGNYPNPFNPTTTIRFGLPRAADVRIHVFDVLGRRVGSPAYGPYPAGWHELSFDASRLSSGTYLLVLEADRSRLSRAMVLDR